MLLAGFVPLSDTGFALPCYAAHSRANAWYVAVCSVDGDHSGTVTGFELYEGGRVEPLSDDLHRRVRVGDTWQDVFLWDGQTFAGGPAVILEALGPELNTLATRIPISALDLALAANELDVRTLAATTFDYLLRRYGADTAERWFRGTLLTGEVRLALRRGLTAIDADQDVMAAVRKATISASASALVANIPGLVAVTLGAANRLDEAARAIERAGRRLGAELEMQVAGPATEPQSTAEEVPSTGEEEGTAEPELQNKAWWPGEAVRILLVVSGERAQAVARHISTPDWVPVPHAPEALRQWKLQRGRSRSEQPPHSGSAIDVLDLDELPASIGAYAAVIWLMDETLVFRARSNQVVLDMIEADPRVVHLLAPALPLQTPSHLLAALAGDGRADFPCHCVIDTSLARSPFWTGNPDRALDRRIADLAISSALLAATEGPVREELLHIGVDGKHLLSVALGRGELDGPDPDLGLVSEISATGLVESSRSRLDVSFGVTPLDRTVRKIVRGYASLRIAEPAFDALAEAVVTLGVLGSVGEESRQPIRRRQVKLELVSASYMKPKAVHSELDIPDWSAEVGTRRGRPIIITAEAPSLQAVQAAWQADRDIVRYTDRETISELLASPGSSTLPRELSLPPLKRIGANRGLAVRGVDPRDVVRLSADAEERWRSDWPGAESAFSARGYLPRVSGWEGGEIVFVRAEIARAVREGNAAAHALFEASGDDTLRLLDRPAKRPADLRAAWTPPGNGDRRFVLEDGRMPVVIMQLPAFTVPAQRMFLIDGDVAVPLFLMSRPFAVWARATMSRSTSWLSRFSISRTFETMSVPRCFEVLALPGERPCLRLAHHGGELNGPAAALEEAFRREGRWTRPLQPRDSNDEKLIRIWREADTQIMDSMGLSADASDVDILARMLVGDDQN